VLEMFQRYKSLIEKWNHLRDGETLELHFSLQKTHH
jgi:hypothetical protein